MKKLFETDVRVESAQTQAVLTGRVDRRGGLARVGRERGVNLVRGGYETLGSLDLGVVTGISAGPFTVERGISAHMASSYLSVLAGSSPVTSFLQASWHS